MKLHRMLNLLTSLSQDINSCMFIHSYCLVSNDAEFVKSQTSAQVLQQGLVDLL